MRSQGFLVRIPEDASQTPEIAPRDGESLSKLQSSSCVGFYRLDPDRATGIQSSAIASRECGPVMQDELPSVFPRAGSLGGMSGPPFPWRNERVIEQRGNFGAGSLLENFTGTLDKAVFVMAYRQRGGVENIGEEQQKSEVEVESLTEYGIVSEYIDHSRGDAVARTTKEKD